MWTWLESYFLIPDSDSIPEQSRWLLRITLDRQKMLDKELRIEDVAAVLKQNYSNDLCVVFSDNNADEMVLRIRVIKKEDDKDEFGNKTVEDDVMLKRLEKHLLDGLTLRGVDGIERAFLNKGSRLVEFPTAACRRRRMTSTATNGTSIRKALRCVRCSWSMAWTLPAPIPTIFGRWLTCLASKEPVRRL